MGSERWVARHLKLLPHEGSGRGTPLAVCGRWYLHLANRYLPHAACCSQDAACIQHTTCFAYLSPCFHIPFYLLRTPCTLILPTCSLLLATTCYLLPVTCYLLPSTVFVRLRRLVGGPEHHPEMIIGERGGSHQVVEGGGAKFITALRVCLATLSPAPIKKGLVDGMR